MFLSRLVTVAVLLLASPFVAGQSPTPSPTITAFPRSEVGDPADAPPNNRCVNAVRMQVNSTVSANTTGALFDFLNQGTCGPRSDRPALWYRVVGTGGKIEVGVCAGNSLVVDFGIFTICNGNSEDCIGYPESRLALCADQDYNTFVVESEKNVPFYIHVRSETQSAEFTVMVTEMEPPSTKPAGAMSLALGGVAAMAGVVGAMLI